MKIVKATHTDFDSFFSELNRNFSPDERRDFRSALSLFDRGEYDVYNICKENGEKVGFISIWDFSDFVYAEHFVIYEKHRNLGYGTEALKAVKEAFKKIVLEAETPENELQRRRLAFYKRNGFLENEKPYMQPAYRKDSSEVSLVIMSYPDILDDFDTVVSQIKERVYYKPLAEQQSQEKI